MDILYISQGFFLERLFRIWTFVWICNSRFKNDNRIFAFYPLIIYQLVPVSIFCVFMINFTCMAVKG